MTINTNASSKEDQDVAGITAMIAGIGQLVLPLARMYLGPSASVIERDDRDVGAGERRLLMFAMHKLIVEMGTLPAPGTAYAPHDGVFSVDDKGQAAALDLRYLLAAARALSAWASAGPGTATAASEAAPQANVAARMVGGGGTGGTSTTTAAMVMNAPAPAPSARTLRTNARARGYAGGAAPARAVPTSGRSGGCGCGGGARAAYAASTAAPASSVSAYRATYSTSSVSGYAKRPTRSAECSDPVPHCDCGGACGGRGCGCAGTQSCTDCIPRGSRAGDLCSCGTCTPPAEDCTPWTPSCETRNRLRACLKDILCDVLACVEQYLCGPGGFDPVALRERRVDFYRCLYDLLCKLLRCIREALCPPPRPQVPCAPPIDCLPCSYAVEESR